MKYLVAILALAMPLIGWLSNSGLLGAFTVVSGPATLSGATLTLLQPGDTFLGMDLACGGHLTHGSPAKFAYCFGENE